MLSCFQSCPTLFNPMRLCGLYPTGSSVHGILQGRILEWLPCPPPGDLPDTGIEPMYLSSSAFQAGFLPTEPSGSPVKVKVKVTQSCPTPCNSPGQNTGVGSLSLLHRIFPTQGSNPGLLHCRQILYPLSHKGSPRILEWVAYPFSSRSSQPRNQTRVSCITGGFFTNWAIREAWEAHK